MIGQQIVKCRDALVTWNRNLECFFGHAVTSILDKSHGNDGSFYARLFVYLYSFSLYMPWRHVLLLNLHTNSIT